MKRARHIADSGRVFGGQRRFGAVGLLHGRPAEDQQGLLHRFDCAQAECGEAVDFVSTAWDLGVRLNLRQEGIMPWVSLGATAAVFDAHVETGTGVVTEDSDLGWGYEVGAGALVPLGGRFFIDPGMRYGRSDVDFASRGTLETRYIVVDLGLVLAF